MPIGRTSDTEVSELDDARLYVIGHPHVGELQISMYDNKSLGVLDSGDRVQYRSPTEAGSSGSPVLTEDLSAVALHEGTVASMEANQGVLLDAIRAKYKASTP